MLLALLFGTESYGRCGFSWRIPTRLRFGPEMNRRPEHEAPRAAAPRVPTQSAAWETGGPSAAKLPKRHRHSAILFALQRVAGGGTALD